MRTGGSEENPVCSVPLVLGTVRQTMAGTFALGMNAVVGLGSGVLCGEGTWTTVLVCLQRSKRVFPRSYQREGKRGSRARRHVHRRFKQRSFER